MQHYIIVTIHKNTNQRIYSSKLKKPFKLCISRISIHHRAATSKAFCPQFHFNKALSEGFECKCIHANPIINLFVIFQKMLQDFANQFNICNIQIIQNSAHRLVILGMANDKMAIMQIRAYLAYCMQHHNCRVQLLQLMRKEYMRKCASDESNSFFFP